MVQGANIVKKKRGVAGVADVSTKKPKDPVKKGLSKKIRAKVPPTKPRRSGEEDVDEEDIEFSDDGDLENGDAPQNLDDNVHDEDDFEVKAEKHRRRILAEGRLAEEEAQQDRSERNVKATPLGDMLAAYDGMESERPVGLVQDQTTEELLDRIKEVLAVLGNFSSEREDGRTRSEYLAVLRSDLMSVFEYNDYLLDAILDMFPPQEAFDFLDAMEKPRPTTIRTNTIKAKRRDLAQILLKRGMNVEPLERWSKVGLQVFETNVPISGTVEYLAGHYMLQSAVSFLPVMALAPQENERVLDMSAAPGGKTTYIAQLMKNTGVLFANDISEPRIKSLSANLQRLGATNCIVTNYDGAGYDKIMRNFDRVLLDAPCTGSGIISRDKSIKTSKQHEDVQRASQQQRRLLLSAIDTCKVGGHIVYSTCSFLVDEDEAVVDYALRKRHVEVVEMGLPFGRPGFTKFRFARFDASLERARRYFPHVHNMDGFFVCKLRKLSDRAADPKDSLEKRQKEERIVTRTSEASAASRDVRRALKKAAEASRPLSAAALKLSVPPETQRRKRPRSADSKRTKTSR